MGPAKYFPSTKSTRVLSRVHPDPVGEVLCECNSFVTEIFLTHSRDELVADLTAPADVVVGPSPLGHFRLSIWTLTKPGFPGAVLILHLCSSDPQP